MVIQLVAGIILMLIFGIIAPVVIIIVSIIYLNTYELAFMIKLIAQYHLYLFLHRRKLTTYQN